MWHGYFVVERGEIGVGNWDTLLNMFVNIGTHHSDFPAYNNHHRTRLDNDAVIYESNFDPTEVSIADFKRLLALAFSVPAEEIDDTQTVVSYSSGNETVVWEFLYDALVRFNIRRFGRSGDWFISGDECRGYLSLYRALWETDP